MERRKIVVTEINKTQLETEPFEEKISNPNEIIVRKFIKQ